MPPHPPTTLGLEPLNVAIGLQGWEDNIEQPKADEDGTGNELATASASQFTSYVWPSSVQEHADGDEGKDGEQRDGESQGARIHPELLALGCPVDGGNRPG